jgi:hypothetical protein
VRREIASGTLEEDDEAFHGTVPRRLEAGVAADADGGVGVARGVLGAWRATSSAVLRPAVEIRRAAATVPSGS